VRAGLGVSAFVLVFFSLGGMAPSLAQAPPTPVPGFMPPYEITRTVRASGFDPLAPPRREGSTYVLRATDFRGILMRVVVDAHSGAIRAVNRIVPPDYPAALGMLPPYDAPPYGMQPYGLPPYGRPPYGALPPDGVPDGAGPQTSGPLEASAPAAAVGVVPAALRAASRSPSFPPLPRPRPAELATQEAANANAQAAKTTAAAPPSPGKADAKAGPAMAAPLPAVVAPSKPAQIPIND